LKIILFITLLNTSHDLLQGIKNPSVNTSVSLRKGSGVDEKLLFPCLTRHPLILKRKGKQMRPMFVFSDAGMCGKAFPEST